MAEYIVFNRILAAQDKANLRAYINGLYAKSLN